MHQQPLVCVTCIILCLPIDLPNSVPKPCIPFYSSDGLALLCCQPQSLDKVVGLGVEGAAPSAKMWIDYYCD